MNKIKFSEKYEKMPNPDGDSIPIEATLLEVFKVKTEDLHKRFIEFDTKFFNEKERNWNYYKLPSGEVLVLLLKSDHINESYLWTTIRRFTPQKYEYYRNLRGESFEIEITAKTENLEGKSE